MTKIRRRTFFRHDSAKAAEDAAIHAATAAWQAAGGEIRRVPPLVGEDLRDHWKALPEPIQFVTALQAQAALEDDLAVSTLDQWKRKLPW